jgi:hypothetical protein
MFSDLKDKLAGFVQAAHSQQRQMLRTINEQWSQNNQNAAAIERHTGQSETKSHD